MTMQHGKTPLHVAALNGHTDVVEALIQAGAEPTTTDEVREAGVMRAQPISPSHACGSILRATIMHSFAIQVYTTPHGTAYSTAYSTTHTIVHSRV